MRLLYHLDPATHAQFEEANKGKVAKASQSLEPSLLENEVPEDFVV